MSHRRAIESSTGRQIVRERCAISVFGSDAETGGEQFADRFDGFSIGSNDLTQLTLGVDRDSERLAELFGENDEAVRILIRRAIEAAHSRGRKVGLYWQAPSDRPEFARFLVEAGIDSMSVSPDTILRVKRHVAAEAGRDHAECP